MPYSTSSARWRAVCARDTAANGVFVYAVKSTGIYCRPTCAARLARRANVDFYDNSVLAEAAGFRPCKRCKPEESGVPDPLAKVVNSVCEAIQKAVAEGRTVGEGKITLNEIAKLVGLTPRYLHKVFKERMNVTPRQYAETLVAVNQIAVASSSMPPIQQTGTIPTAPITPGPMDDFDLDLYADQNLLGSTYDLVAWDLCADFPLGDDINQPFIFEPSIEPLIIPASLPTPSDSSAGSPAAGPFTWP